MIKFRKSNCRGLPWNTNRDVVYQSLYVENTSGL